MWFLTVGSFVEYKFKDPVWLIQIQIPFVPVLVERKKESDKDTNLFIGIQVETE